MQQETVNVFIAYSRKDEEIKERLKTVLKVLVQIKQIDSIWDDSAIEAGSEWEKSIHNQLDNADIILLVISRDFLASDYCFGIEMRKAMKVHEEGKTRVIPIIARHCSWDMTDLKKLQALPENGKPIIDKWDTEDIPYYQIERNLTAIATNIKRKKRRRNLQEQFEHFLKKGEEDFKQGNWEEANEWYEEAKKFHDEGFKPSVKELEEKISQCEKEKKEEKLLAGAIDAVKRKDIQLAIDMLLEAFFLEFNNSSEVNSILNLKGRIDYFGESKTSSRFKRTLLKINKENEIKSILKKYINLKD